MAEFKYYVRPTKFSIVNALYMAAGTVAQSEFYVLWHLHMALTMLINVVGVLYVANTAYILYKFRAILVQPQWENKLIKR